MYLFKIKLNYIALQGLFFFLIIKNIICIKVVTKSNGREKISQKVNPWEPYMLRYHIPMNHKSGVYIDLGGSVGVARTNDIYRYANGLCPIFGKSLLVNNLNGLTDATLNDISGEDAILNLIFKGVDASKVFSSGLNFNADKLGEKLIKYKDLKSPVKKDTIYECAQYANKFYHEIITTEPIKVNISHPFIYNLMNQECYVLLPITQEIQEFFPISQRNNERQVRRIYDPSKVFSVKPVKSNNSYVFGSPSLREDWAQSCPIKPIKGAKFGYWINNECTESFFDTCEENFNECSSILFSLSSNDLIQKPSKVPTETLGHGVNWATSHGNNCTLMMMPPNCLIYDKDAYSFTSSGMFSQDIYDLPPCIDASIGWTINASCGSLHNKQFTCQHGNKWVANTGEEITKCFSTSLWANFDNAGKIDRNIDHHTPRKKDSSTSKPSSAFKSWSAGAFMASITIFIISALFYI